MSGLSVHSHRFQAMGSPCEVSLQGELNLLQPLFKQLQAEVARLESKYSRYLHDSITTQINALTVGDQILVDKETASLLDYANTCYEHSQGLFDITSGVLRKAWDFKSNTVPSQTLIDDLLTRVGWQHVQWDGKYLSFTQPNMEIDFGGVVKEFTADLLAQICRDKGVHSGLIELGGDIRIVGPKFDQHQTPQPWLVGIRDPKTGDAMASIPLYEGGIATSGSYERFMIVDGQHYCHILNPKTGWPVHALPSVTVVSPHCLVAGSLATMAILQGESAYDWLNDQDASFLIMQHNGELIGTIKSP